MLQTAAFGAIVLAGGRSSRFGRDKASEPFLGRTLLQHVIDRVAPLVSEVIVVRAADQRLPSIESPVAVRIVDDEYPGAGPLGGIYTGLRAATAECCLALACDMPLLSAPLLRELQRRVAGCDVVMPLLEHPEPLHAVYSRVCLEPMRAELDAGRFKLTGFLGAVHVCYMNEDDCRALDPDLRSFVNTNTQEDLRRIEELLQR